MSGRKYAEVPVAQEAYARLWERLRAVPGVLAAGGTSALPLSQMMAWGPITVEGRAARPAEAFVNVDIRRVGGSSFEAMQIPLIRGRLFTSADSRNSFRAIVVDEWMANQLWPNEDPIGKRVRTAGWTRAPMLPG